VHEPKDRVDVALIDSTTPKLLVLVVIDAPNAISQSLVTFKLDPQKHRKLAILKAPKVLTILALTRNEAPPELHPYE
jgi:hypothetical protein